MGTLQKTQVILTVEHGGHKIPAPYAPLFRGQSQVLKSHRGWDQGALVIAKVLQSKWGSPLVASTTSRLLIDLNRSLSHKSVFSEYTQDLQPDTKDQIIARYYAQYRAEVEDTVAKAYKRGERVLHLSIHSFTPVWNHVRRKTDIGILFDPARPGETNLASYWQSLLRKDQYFRDWAVHRNRPYQGKSDGFTTYLRTIFSGESSKKQGEYLGIELEINQKFLKRENSARSIGREIARVLALGEHHGT